MANTFHVYGPPGCGKTTYLVEQITKAAESRGPENVLVASLTKAASTEMATRSTGLPDNNVGTLHSHCYRQLGSPEIADKNLDIWNQENKGSNFSLTEESKGGLDYKRAESKSLGQKKGDENYALMNMYRSQMKPIAEWPQPVKNFFNRWTAWKEDCGFMDFTEMIERGITDTWSAPGSPQVLIGDETQDWSKLEMSLFRDHWGERAEVVMMAGDPDQTIFSWRGADSGCFMDHKIPEENKRFLTQSYRLPKEPHAYARELIGRINSREDVEFSSTDNLGTVERCSASSRNCGKVMAIIEEEVKAGRKVMVLATCNYILLPLIKRLRREGIPFHNPYRPENAMWNPLSRSKKKVMPTDRLLAFLKLDENTWGSSAGDWDGSDINKWMSILRQEGLLERGVKSRIADKNYKAPKTLDDFKKLFLYPEDVDKALDLNLDWWESRMMGSSLKSMEFPLSIAKKRGGKALWKAPNVVVGTIHSVKGGEADTVIIFPDLSPQAHELLHKKEERDNAVRLFYVAVTRTKDRLILCNAEGLRFTW